MKRLLILATLVVLAITLSGCLDDGSGQVSCVKGCEKAGGKSADCIGWCITAR